MFYSDYPNLAEKYISEDGSMYYDEEDLSKSLYGLVTIALSIIGMFCRIRKGILIHYKKFYFSENAFHTFVITYPASKQDLYGPIMTHISKSFVPGF